MINRILQHRHFRAFLGIEIVCSLLFFGLLFFFTKTDPIIPINFSLAVAFCLILSSLILLMFYVIIPLKIKESIYGSVLWMIPALLLAIYTCKINKFVVIKNFYGADDLVFFIVKLSIFHMIATIILGLLTSPMLKRVGMR